MKCDNRIQFEEYLRKPLLNKSLDDALYAAVNMKKESILKYSFIMGYKFPNKCIESPIIERDFNMIKKLLSSGVEVSEDLICYIIKNDDIELLRRVVYACKFTTCRPMNCAICEKNNKIIKMLCKMSIPFDDTTMELAKISGNIKTINYFEEKMTSTSSYP